MPRVEPGRFWRSVIRALPGSLLVGLVTFLCFGLGLNLTITGFVYLVLVVLQSLIGDFISSAVVSVIAVGCLDFFFIPPLFSFQVTHPIDIGALTTFLITALVITRLTTQVREHASTSERQRNEMKRLYELAQRLLALNPEKAMLAKSVECFRAVFDLRAVCLYDGIDAELHSAGESTSDLANKTRAACIARQNSDDNISGVFIRCLHAAGKIRGAVGFDGLQDAELTVGPLTALAAAMLERARAFQEASHAVAATEAEVFRGAILDALAHEFKTPLATIVTAAGGLHETGSLGPEQLELAEMVETEASRLGVLTSRLLRIAQLDRDEVKPQLELTDIAGLVTHLVDQYSQRWTDRQFSVRRAATSLEVLADIELIQLAIRQLLDNACKYSHPNSAITVSIESQNRFVIVRVWNSGSSIASADRARVFERFYRGAETRRLAPGSGLGLYVARKIVTAHGGILDLEKETSASEGTAFRLTVPLAPSNL